MSSIIAASPGEGRPGRERNRVTMYNPIQSTAVNGPVAREGAVPGAPDRAGMPLELRQERAPEGRSRAGGSDVVRDLLGRRRPPRTELLPQPRLPFLFRTIEHHHSAERRVTSPGDDDLRMPRRDHRDRRPGVGLGHSDEVEVGREPGEIGDEECRAEQNGAVGVRLARALTAAEGVRHRLLCGLLRGRTRSATTHTKSRRKMSCGGSAITVAVGQVSKNWTIWTIGAEMSEKVSKNKTERRKWGEVKGKVVRMSGFG